MSFLEQSVALISLTASSICRAIGGKVSKFPDVETAWKVGVEITLTAAQAFDRDLAPKLPQGQKFRFIFCSGMLAEWDQSKNLHFLKDSRHIKVCFPATSVWQSPAVEHAVIALVHHSFDALADVPTGQSREGSL